MQERIKEELLKELYTKIDTIYDFLEQRFVLTTEHENIMIGQLNRLKDQLYAILHQSKLS